MKFFREIHIDNLSQEMYNNLEQEGATFVIHESTVEIWFPKSPEDYD